jgi:hypothetical protein
MPRTNVVGTTAPPGSGAQRCAQAGEREHITDSTTGSAATTAAWSSPALLAYDGQRCIGDAICHQCGKPLPPTTRRHARFCSPAHRAAYHRSSIAAGMARVRFLTGAGRDNPAAMARYVAIAPDTAFPGMYRLKRTDSSFSDMMNLTRARDALAQSRARP